MTRCGLPADAPRVVPARSWLEANFSVRTDPGKSARERESLRDATYYYYCWSAADALMGLGIQDVETKAGKLRWAEALARELFSRQRADGSWANSFANAKQDDPLVTTPLAAAAVAICRQAATGEEQALVPRVPGAGYPAMYRR